MMATKVNEPDGSDDGNQDDEFDGVPETVPPSTYKFSSEPFTADDRKVIDSVFGPDPGGPDVVGPEQDGGNATGAPMPLEAFDSAVRPLLAELEASANAHDTDRHMGLYAREPSLTFVFNGEIVRGWDQLRQLQCQWWSDDKPRGGYKYLDGPIIEALGDDAGVTTLLIAAEKKAADGSVVAKTLAYSALWRRFPEGWRITLAHESNAK
jgi:ketosteroid isomerase-like protein